MSKTDRHYAGGQIVGRRKRQEDEYGVLALSHDDPEALLLTVADGMGGHAGGAEAAHAAVEKFVGMFESSTGDVPDRLIASLHAANAAIATLTEENPALNGAGCTLVAAVIEGDMLSWISVGASSLLRLRNNVLERLNADHSMRPVLKEMVTAGRMTAEDIEANPHRNALRSALTGEEIDLIDLNSNVALEPGDQLLLASDGLDVLPPERISTLLEEMRERSLQETINALLAAVEAEKIPRQDNATAVLYRRAGAPRTREAGRATRRRRANTAMARLHLALAAGVLLLLGVTMLWLLATGSGRAFAQTHGWPGSPPDRRWLIRQREPNRS